jgi:hypothetical protein
MPETHASRPVQQKIFTLAGMEFEAARIWQLQHPCRDQLRPTTGEQFVYEFMPTGMGTMITVKCLYCAQEQNVTDFEVLLEHGKMFAHPEETLSIGRYNRFSRTLQFWGQSRGGNGRV